MAMAAMIVTMAVVIFTVTVFIVFGFVLFFLFVFSPGFRTIFYVMQGHAWYLPVLSPQESEVFLADGEGIVHRLVQSQLEYEDKVFDILIDIGQIFRNILFDRFVTVSHVG